MSYIGNSPGVSSQRVVTEEVISGSPKSAFYPVGGYSLGYVDVLINGVEVDNNDFTATDGVLITLAVAAAVGDTVKIKCYLPRGLSDGYLKSEADAKYLALTGDQAVAGVKTFSGNVGFGTTTPLDVVHVAKAGGSGNGGRVRIQNSGVRQWSIGTKDASFTIYDETGAAERVAIDASGNMALVAGNLVLPSGKGIDFSANSNAGGMTGEVLSDYEEGSWTPNWRIGSNAAGTWVVKTGRYTKVGNMVTVWAYLYSSTGRGAGTGSVTISNLPFNSVNSSLTNYHIMDARGGVSWSGGGAGLPYFYHPASTSYIIAYYTSNGTGAVTVQMTEANFSASGAIEINIMMTYETN